MFFPESLYLLSARDQQVTWLEPVLSRLTAVQAAAGVSSPDFTVPDGRVLLLQSASCFGTPTAPQTVSNVELRTHGPDNVDISIRNELPAAPPPAGVSLILNWAGSVLIPPRWVVYTRGSFSAALAPNVVAQSLIGLLIPVANIQRI